MPPHSTPSTPCPPSLLLCEAALGPAVVLQGMGCAGGFCTLRLSLDRALPRTWSCSPFTHSLTFSAVLLDLALGVHRPLLHPGTPPAQHSTAQLPPLLCALGHPVGLSGPLPAAVPHGRAGTMGQAEACPALPQPQAMVPASLLSQGDVGRVPLPPPRSMPGVGVGGPPT